MDRVDIQVEVPRLTREQIQRRKRGEPSGTVRNRVAAARELQGKRFQGNGAHCNAEMTHAQLEEYCFPGPEGERFLGLAVERLGLSARSYDRVLKVARTIADLAGSHNVEVEHVAEAVQYRCLDRTVR